MARSKVKLEMPSLAAQIDHLYAKERIGWRKTRLLAVKLAARGEHSAAEIADLCGISRGRFFEWLKQVRRGGLDELLSRQKPGPKPGLARGVAPGVLEELKQKLEAGEFNTAVQAQRWLEQTHGVSRSYRTVLRWLKKAGGVLMVPRPSHSKKDPAAAEAFPQELADKLQALDLPAGSRVKIWMMDEARFGLHTEMRRLWGLKGKRPVIAHQIKYQWDYLYGSLDIISGQAHFCQIPGVNLEWDRAYLEDLAASDPEAIHIVIRDQAGFHLREGDSRLPERIRIVDLPPYSPELNPCEQLWDLIKEAIGNRTYASIEALREAMIPALRSYWEDGQRVLQLIGRDWLQLQANALPKIQKSF